MLSRFASTDPGRKTRLLVLVASLGCGAAVAAAICPPAVAALFAIAAALVALVSLELGRPWALAGLGAAATILLVAQLAVAVEAVDPRFALFGTGPFIHPALAQGSTWLPVLAAILLLAGTAAVALWTSAGAFGSEAPGQRAADGAPWPEWPALPVMHGLDQVERELVRARQYRRELSLSLIAIDGPGADRSDEPELMERLIELVRRELTGFDLLIRYAPSELLMVLPELSAAAARPGIGLLAEMAGRQLGHPVRAAVVTYPEDGASRVELLSALVAALPSRPAGDRDRQQPAPSRQRARGQWARLRRGRFRISS